jgi:hypothetical protein
MATVRTSPSLDALVPSRTRYFRAANLSPRTASPTRSRRDAWARPRPAEHARRGQPDSLRARRGLHRGSAGQLEPGDGSGQVSEPAAAVPLAHRRGGDPGQPDGSDAAPKVPEQPVAVLTLEVLNGRQTPLSATDMVKNLLFLRRRLDRRGRTRSALRQALGSFRRHVVAKGRSAVRRRLPSE